MTKLASNDDEALSAACLLLVQSHRAGETEFEEIAAAAIAMIEMRSAWAHAMAFLLPSESLE